MRYAGLKAKGYGSGVVEAANKVHQRRAGMRWSVEGGVLTFKALIRSGRFYLAWQTMIGIPAANLTVFAACNILCNFCHMRSTPLGRVEWRVHTSDSPSHNTLCGNEVLS